jgi:hypothetical protein
MNPYEPYRMENFLSKFEIILTISDNHKKHWQTINSFDTQITCKQCVTIMELAIFPL